jgi:hypothetical protein
LVTGSNVTPDLAQTPDLLPAVQSGVVAVK